MVRSMIKFWGVLMDENIQTRLTKMYDVGIDENLAVNGEQHCSFELYGNRTKSEPTNA